MIEMRSRLLTQLENVDLSVQSLREKTRQKREVRRKPRAREVKRCARNERVCLLARSSCSTLCKAWHRPLYSSWSLPSLPHALSDVTRMRTPRHAAAVKRTIALPADVMSKTLASLGYCCWRARVNFIKFFLHIFFSNHSFILSFISRLDAQQSTHLFQRTHD